MTNATNQATLRQIGGMLKYTYGLVPIAAGADKFLNLLVHWDIYVNPSIAGILPFSTSVFMMIVGVIEIIAGVIVLRKTQIGAYIVSGWLLLISLSLLLSGHYLDVAVRDLVMAIGAFGLAKLSGIINNDSK